MEDIELWCRTLSISRIFISGREDFKRQPGFIPINFTSSENSNHGRESFPGAYRQNIAGHCQQAFCIHKFVDNTQQYFIFTPFQPINLNSPSLKVKVWGQNPKYFLLYKQLKFGRCVIANQYKGAYFRIDSLKAHICNFLVKKFQPLNYAPKGFTTESTLMQV